MNTVFKSIVLSSLITLILSISSPAAAEEGFVSLFDGETLEGWTAARSKGEGDWGPFAVDKEQKAIHVYAGQEAGSKQKNDCLNTVKEFSHFILKLEYKWVGKRFKPRADWDRDAGLLYHVHGDLTRVWPFSMEMQIGETPGDSKNPSNRRFHTGDLFILGRHLSAKTPHTGRFYDAEAKPSKGRNTQTRLGVEKPMGEWNKMEIHVHGADKATYIFNEQVVLELFDLRQKSAEGDTLPLDKGHIGLQAEWAEIMYRNIRIKELSPEEMSK